MKGSRKVKSIFLLILLAAAAFIYVRFPINLGLDLQGGTRLILEAKETPNIQIDQQTILGVLSIIRNRINSLGISEPIIQKKGLRQIIVELPGIKDPERAIKLIGETALLEFKEGEWAPGNADQLTPQQIEILAGKGAVLSSVPQYDNQGKIISERPIFLHKTVLTGAFLKSASPGTDQHGKPAVNIEFNAEGGKIFRDITTTSVGKPLAILLDGTVISAPNINEPIPSGRAIISGGFSLKEMKDLVIKLKAGALPVPVEIISNKIVGPSLGKDSIEKSKRAAILGLVMVCIFMALIYRVPGVFAGIALLIYLFFTLCILKLFHATLTLPGIAGLILTMGMAVDANVIIFERIKEEEQAGHPLKIAIPKGFSRAFLTILDANITTLISAIVLFWLGTGTIKGFALTLSIGILMSMFTAIFVTRIFMDFMAAYSENRNKPLFKVKEST
ncbi:MAG: protein translocase subunit SecD [Candidatus Margulisbacteria bacterium]|nr:protein translocase subunit SecD [Candidatus Margulisiibacteriota bacterium]